MNTNCYYLPIQSKGRPGRGVPKDFLPPGAGSWVPEAEILGAGGKREKNGLEQGRGRCWRDPTVPDGGLTVDAAQRVRLRVQGPQSEVRGRGMADGPVS